jgi:hypothetical protein
MYCGKNPDGHLESSPGSKKECPDNTGTGEKKGTKQERTMKPDPAALENLPKYAGFRRGNEYNIFFL